MVLIIIIAPIEDIYGYISINCCVRLTFSNLILLYITLWDGKHKVQLFLKALSSMRSTAWVMPADCKKGMVEGFVLHSTQG